MVGQAGINYANTFGKHALELLALAEVRDSRTYKFSAYAKNLPFTSLPELSYALPNTSPISGDSGASRSVD